jgi:hypothetical protein
MTAIRVTRAVGTSRMTSIAVIRGEKVYNKIIKCLPTFEKKIQLETCFKLFY